MKLGVWSHPISKLLSHQLYGKTPIQIQGEFLQVKHTAMEMDGYLIGDMMMLRKKKKVENHHSQSSQGLHPKVKAGLLSP